MKTNLIKLVYTALFAVLLLPFGSNVSFGQASHCFFGNIVDGSSMMDCHDGTGDIFSTGWDYQIAGANEVNLEFWCTSYCRSNLPGYKFGPAPGDLRAAIQNAIAHLLSDAFPPALYNNTPEIVHMYLPECWQLSVGNDNDPPPRCTGLSPCDNTTCCEQDYRRTKDINGNITVQKISTVTTNNDKCTPTTCTNVCSATNYWPNTVTYLQGTSSFSYTASARISAEDINNTNNSLNINPNPAQDQVNIIFSNSLNGNLNIMIFDIAGNLVDNLREGKKSQEETYNVNVSKYTNGKYFVQLYLEGQFIGGSSFIINR